MTVRSLSISPIEATLLDYLPSEEQFRHFEEQGYLVVPGALSEGEYDRLEVIVDAIWEGRRTMAKYSTPTSSVAIRPSSAY